MGYIMGIVAVILLLYIKSIWDRKNEEAKLLRKIEAGWGQVPLQEYTYDKLISIGKYYEMQKEASVDVDDITWNDLDMDQVFMLLNHTESSLGEEYLYSLLRKLQFTKETLEERNRLVSFFQTHERERVSLQKSLMKMGKLKDISFYEYVNRVDSITPHKPYWHYFSVIGLILALISLAIPALGNWCWFLIVGFVIFNIFTYYRRKAQIEIYFNVISYILRSIYQIQNISALSIPEMEDYLKELSSLVKEFRSFRRNSQLVVSQKISGSLADAILDYIRMLFHVDLIKFDSMVKVLRNKKNQLNRMFEIVGLLDSMIAVASFRALFQEEYCIPVLSPGRDLHIKADEIYHPLIINPVKNSIETKKSVLLTGSNASGKSTFIKTIAINGILAQTINTCLSKNYEANFYKIYSSMALRDDIMSQESYYIVEIKSLKRIYDESGHEIPLLCFVDEVLRGTNTAERIGASSQILKNLALRNAMIFAATHDIELTYILEAYYDNYHFEEEIKEENVTFDYLLHSGRATSRNAIRLLGMMGYDESIIQAATEEVVHFLDTNRWNSL